MLWAAQPYCLVQAHGDNSQTVLLCGAQSFAVLMHS